MIQHPAEYKSQSMGAFLHHVKNIIIPFEYVHEDTGAWSCWTTPGTWGVIQTHGSGATLDEAVDDYLDALKEIAECIFDSYSPGDENIAPEFLMKVLVTPKEQLKSCLNGKTCDDF